jgi:hypothetical protein
LEREEDDFFSAAAELLDKSSSNSSKCSESLSSSAIDSVSTGSPSKQAAKIPAPQRAMQRIQSFIPSSLVYGSTHYRLKIRNYFPYQH